MIVLEGEKKVAAMMQVLPDEFFYSMQRWIRDERAWFLGGKTSKGTKKKGFRNILANRKRKGRPGKWTRRIIYLFKGWQKKVSNKDINKLLMTMGILGTSHHQLHKALFHHQSGGIITSNKYMPVPIYKNLRKWLGYTGPWSKGDVHDGLKSQAFDYISTNKGLVGLRSGDKILFFHPKAKRKRGEGYLKSGLLFIGTKSIKTNKMFFGRYDFFDKFDRAIPRIIARGQIAVNKTVRKIEKKYY